MALTTAQKVALGRLWLGELATRPCRWFVSPDTCATKTLSERQAVCTAKGLTIPANAVYCAPCAARELVSRFDAL